MAEYEPQTELITGVLGVGSYSGIRFIITPVNANAPDTFKINMRVKLKNFAKL